MQREAILEQVIKMVAEVVECEPSEITPNASLPDELGIDSLMGLEVLVMVERFFGIKLGEEQLHLMTTPERITDLVIGNKEAVAA
ncbi:MAG: acyl carrier protein [Saprospiraceae bacterium]|nr:acyl carrier protein [Saprospiraceae bacterium]